MSDPDLMGGVPSTPNPATVTLVAAFLRWALTMLSGAGILGGLVINDGQLITASGAIIGIITFAWGQFQKFQAKRKDHLGNEMSAELHKPVQPA